MIRVEKAHLTTVAQTHPGMSGKNNEDRFGVTAFRLSDKNPTPVVLAVLCDGIGGHRAGEVAAELAVNTISHVVAESDGSNPIAILQTAIVQASQQIYQLAQQDGERRGMGSTCVSALIIKNRLYAATVGDSRLYLLRNGVLRKLSTDHTWIQEALDAGILQPDQVEGHPNAHVIRRYLGSPQPPEVDIRLRLSDSETNAEAIANQGMALKSGDKLLLCSDGLTDLVKDHEIQEILKTQPMETAVQTLIDLANERGGHDNITIILIQAAEMTLPIPAGFPIRRVAIGCAGGILLALLIGAVVWGILWWRNRGVSPTPTPVSTIAGETQLPLFPETPPAPFTATLSAPDATATSESALPEPLVNGATLTPWPTNTLGAISTPTSKSGAGAPPPAQLTAGAPTATQGLTSTLQSPLPTQSLFPTLQPPTQIPTLKPPPTLQPPPTLPPPSFP
jgi:serine/threonine protein phosphatase PrpC